MLVVDIECLLAFFVIAAADICGFFLFEQAQSEYDAGRDCRQHLSRYRGVFSFVTAIVVFHPARKRPEADAIGRSSLSATEALTV